MKPSRSETMELLGGLNAKRMMVLGTSGRSPLELVNMLVLAFCRAPSQLVLVGETEMLVIRPFMYANKDPLSCPEVK